jgi:hypothetical protein
MRFRARFLSLAVLVACGESTFSGDTETDTDTTESNLVIPPSPIPGIVQAEDFRTGSNGDAWLDSTPNQNLGGAYRPRSGVDIEETSDSGGGYDIGWIEAGEWLEYQVSVATAGRFAFNARVKATTDGTKSLQFVVNGTALAAAQFSNTAWSTVNLGEATLSAGEHVVRVLMKTGGFKLNYMQASNACVPTTCAAEGKNCGSIPDGCGGTLTCGSCSSGTCGGGGVPNVCGSSGSGLLDNFRAIGFSTSRSGLGVSESEFLARLNQMSAASKIPLADLKKKVWSHHYNTGFNGDAQSLGSFKFVAQQGLAGIVQNQRFGGDALAGWARGDYDERIRAYLKSVSAWAAANGTKAILILHHEPENDTNAAEANLWSRGEARFIKIASEHNDPNVIACVNLMFWPQGDATNYDFTDDLLELCGGNQTCKQKVLDRTLLGLDPYPEVRNGEPGLATDRIQEGLEFYGDRGLKHFYLPEVGLFQWKAESGLPITNPDGVFQMTDRQQAQRLHDEFCVHMAEKPVRGFTYFDVSDWSETNYRSPTRELGAGKIGPGGVRYSSVAEAQAAAPLELAEYARIIMGIPHARP